MIKYSVGDDNMLHNEARKLVLEAWDKTHNAKEIAKYFSVNESTIYRLVEKRTRTGSYETRTYLRGRKPILTEKQHQDILELVQKQPDITMNEIIEILHLPVGNEAVRRFLIKQGYTYKKSLCMQKNRSVPDVQIKRKTWIENIAGAKPEHQIYLDESGINTNLTRHYAHAVHGKRAIDAAPINTPAGTTVLSSIRLNGSLVYTTYQGGTTAQRFREYMKEQLIPSLEKDDVVIMDNMRSHHAKIVTELLDKSGISYLYLPPYSPDLNPIEKMWSKMKSILRKRKIRIASELPEAVKAALEAVSTNDCRGWFRACGICTN